MTISEIIKTYRSQRQLTYRAMAEAINERLPEAISHQTLADWEAGNYLPRYWRILPVSVLYRDWRADMAREILAVIKPELYGST